MTLADDIADCIREVYGEYHRIDGVDAGDDRAAAILALPEIARALAITEAHDNDELYEPMLHLRPGAVLTHDGEDVFVVHDEVFVVHDDDTPVTLYVHMPSYYGVEYDGIIADQRAARLRAITGEPT